MSDNMFNIPEEPHPEELIPLRLPDSRGGLPGSQGELPDSQGDFPDLPSVIVVRRIRVQQTPTRKPVQRPFNIMESIMDLARNLSFAFIIAMLLVVFVAQKNDVNGPSMEPTLYGNDAVFVELVSKYVTSPTRGEIMTVNAHGLPGYTEKGDIIKRVIGLPGETVTIKDGKVYINDVQLVESYLGEGVQTYVNFDPAAVLTVTLGKDEYFFMGDNRTVSLDSRIMGPITKNRIRSHVLARMFPVKDFKLL